MRRFEMQLVHRMVLLSLGLVCLCPVTQAQQFSHVLSFQGRLCTTDGEPLPDGPYIVQFAMYEAQTGGTALWTESQSVTQVGGVFVAYLGSATPFPADLFAGGDRWLGIKVGDDAEMPERFRLTPSPSAIHAAAADVAHEAEHAVWADGASEAGSADMVDGIHAAAEPMPNYLLPLGPDRMFPAEVVPPDEDWTFSENSIYRLGGQVGIGDLPAPEWKLLVTTATDGAAMFSTTGLGEAGVFAIDRADNPRAALAAYTTGLGAAGRFENTNPESASPAVMALCGGLNDDTQVIHAGYTGEGPYNATAVYGECVPQDYYGFGGRFVGGYTGVAGVVYPTANRAYTGVSGWVSGGFGANYGVSGLADGDGFCVGLHGSASGSETNIGVYASAVAGKVNYAGYFVGDLHATGRITRSYGSGECAAAPIAYATIESDGSILSGTTNVSCAWHGAAEQYEITIQGEYYNSEDYTTVATSASGLYIPFTSSIGGKLVVGLAMLSGHNVQTRFGFITYKR
jgi:hypothetical protein